MRTLITGGTGSLGRALAKHLLRETADDIIVLSRDEYKQAQMAEELGRNPRMRYFLGDVRDEARLVVAFRGVERVVHAAALKRVDAVAGESLELMKTNVLGTANVLSAARMAGVQRVLLISTDKACQPINVYGASKFLAEQLTANANAYGYPVGCVSSVLRYGNVLGSRGSAVETWRRQVFRGESPTVTDPTMTRFVLTIHQAVGFVMDAFEIMEGGETLIPLGLERTTISNLLTAVVGFVPDESHGRRPGGEKLDEVLLCPDEAQRAFQRGGFAVVPPHVSGWRRGSWPIPARLEELWSCDPPMMTVSGLRAMLKENQEEGL